MYKSLKDFCKNNWAECTDFEDFIDEIEHFQIKKAVRKIYQKNTANNEFFFREYVNYISMSIINKFQFARLNYKR